MKADIITDTECKITNDAVKGSSTNIIPKGNVVIATRVGLGKVCLLKHDTAINQDLRGIVPSKPDSLEIGFLFWWLKSIAHIIEGEGTGATVQGVKLPFIKSLPLPVPPLPEQRRIVGILDEAFAGLAKAIEHAEANLNNARELFESELNAIFSNPGPDWTEKKLGDVCAITSPLVDPRKNEFLDLIHVGAANIESKTSVLAELKTAREEGLVSGKFPFDPTMVLYSKIRPYLMKVARPDFNGLCSADMYPLAPISNEVTRDFLFYLLMSKVFTDYAIQGSARAGMPKVNRKHLFEFSTWLPSTDEQLVIAAKLDELAAETKRLEAIYRQKLALLAELKQSLLHKAFSGEL